MTFSDSDMAVVLKFLRIQKLSWNILKLAWSEKDGKCSEIVNTGVYDAQFAPIVDPASWRAWAYSYYIMTS